MFAADIYQVYNIKQMTAIEKLPQNASAKLNQEKKINNISSRNMFH